VLPKISQCIARKSRISKTGTFGLGEGIKRINSRPKFNHALQASHYVFISHELPLKAELVNSFIHSFAEIARIEIDGLSFSSVGISALETYGLTFKKSVNQMVSKISLCYEMQRRISKNCTFRLAKSSNGSTREQERTMIAERSTFERNVIFISHEHLHEWRLVNRFV
jgi:hypothetical protein